MIMEFIAFIKLRIDNPAASRPYKIPIGTTGSILMCIPPTLLILVVLALASLKVVVISLFIVSLGLIIHPCLTYTDRKRWLKFSVSSDVPDFHSASRYQQCSSAS